VSTAIRVLIVDDDVPTRIGLRAIFAGEPDISVVGECADADGAYQSARSEHPDVVLMDVRLRDGDGIRATERILADAPADAGAPRVIVLTTFELDEYAFRSMRAGASGFLLKRTKAEDIVNAVRVVAAGSSLPMPKMSRHLIAEYADRGAGGASDVPSLTDRESEVLVLIARGLSNQEIAERLTIRLDTVKSHIKHVFSKLAVRDRAQAVIAAYESGLVMPGSPLSD
jgi:DNA-binding NarL/FixJ family response regulator